MTDLRSERCEELRVIIIELAPLIVEAQGNADRLSALSPLIDRLRGVAALGAEGIDEPAYRQWVTGADENLTAFADAIAARDPRAAWAAFSDQRTGLNLLSTGCAGCTGW